MFQGFHRTTQQITHLLKECEPGYFVISCSTICSPGTSVIDVMKNVIFPSTYLVNPQEDACVTCCQSFMSPESLTQSIESTLKKCRNCYDRFVHVFNKYRSILQKKIWIIFFHVSKISLTVLSNKNEEGNWCSFLICLHPAFYGMARWFTNASGIFFDS